MTSILTLTSSAIFTSAVPPDPVHWPAAPNRRLARFVAKAYLRHPPPRHARVPTGPHSRCVCAAAYPSRRAGGRPAYPRGGAAPARPAPAPSGAPTPPGPSRHRSRPAARPSTGRRSRSTARAATTPEPRRREPAQQAEGSLHALPRQPIQGPDQQHVVAAGAGAGQSLGQLVAVLALPCRRAVQDVLGRDVQASALGPGAQLGQLVAGVLVVGGHSRPDGAAGGHRTTLGARCDSLRSRHRSARSADPSGQGERAGATSQHSRVVLSARGPVGEVGAGGHGGGMLRA
jgi:hypothetical protein